MIELIPLILLKFRIGRIGVIADIKKAFLQISISPLDRNYLRFLWWKDSSRKEMKVYRHTRVVFGVSSSPFHLAATLNCHLDKAPRLFEKTILKLKDSFYVDNCVTSFETVNELRQFISESKFLMSSANFDLRGWMYNLKDKLFKENDEELPSLGNTVSVFGMQWNLDNDTLGCDTNGLNEVEKLPVTKRGLLSAAQRIFDPIGFTSPVTLVPKILLQNCWKTKITWDDELPEEITTKFKKWLSQIRLLNLCHISRPLFMKKNNENLDSTLHVFCDASQLAYASCIFLRTTEGETVNVYLLLAKSRIAPIKSITIPRLELMAALIGCRLCNYLLKSEVFKSLKMCFWTDSKVVLTWIKEKLNWSVFVNNRVTEIRTLSDKNDWHYESS